MTSEDLVRNMERTVLLKTVYYMIENRLGVEASRTDPAMLELDEIIGDFEAANIYIMSHDLQIGPLVVSPVDRGPPLVRL